MGKQSRRRYSAEFKANAIDLVETQGYTSTEAARRLGINRSMLDRWRSKANRGDPGGDASSTPDERDKELRRLREENRKLREEKEILKKATAFFASESD